MRVRNVLVASAVCSVLASAAIAAETPQPGEVGEVVVVTGSYIKGAVEDTALPVDVISSDDLEKRGSPSTLDMLKQLNVSNGVLGDTNQFDARAQGSEGTGTVNLRGLGPQRTLVLLNGRRLVSSPFAGGPVDTNLIPSAAIGRVEVLKDGAAATYGSDAIAGVVNFITKQNFEGFALGGDYKDISDSSGDYNGSIAWGMKGDSWNLFTAVGYQHRSELLAKDRDFAHPAYTKNPQGGYSASGNPATFLPIGVTAPTAANPLGLGPATRDPQCGNLGGTPGFSGATPVCYWQYVNFDALTEKEDHYQAYAEFNKDVFSGSKLHFEGLYAGTEIPIYRTSPSYAALQTPSSIANGGTSPINNQYFVPATNPGFADFVAKNPGVFGANPASGALVVAYRPFAIGGNPLFDYGASEGPRHYDAYRGSLGLSGQITDKVGYDVAVTYMEENARRQGRDSVVNRVELGLRGLGGPNCNVAANTPGANGCFWLNPFSNAIPGNPITGVTNAQFSNTAGISNNNRELVDWMFPTVSTRQQTTTTVVDAVLNGQTGITLPGGDLGWAAGLQYRRNTLKATYSDLNNFAVTPCINSIKTGIVGPSACTPAQLAAPTGGLLFLGGANDANLDGDIKAAFFEFSLPVLDSFQAQLAGRYEDYGGDTGSTFDPKLSLRWQLVDGFALRGSVGTTFRGPSLANTDPGSVTTLQSVAGTFRAVRTFGNPGLKPEDAFTFNVGAIAKFGGFSASLDYWSFDFDKQIVVEPLAGLVNSVFGTVNGVAAPGCTAALIGRFSFSTASGQCDPNAGVTAANPNPTQAQRNAANLATTARVDLNTINGPKVKTAGIDLSLQYLFDQVPGGTITIGADVTDVLKYDIGALSIAGVPVQPSFDAVGKLNYQTTAYPLPKWKGIAFGEYAFLGMHNIRYQANYVDSYVDQRTDIFLPSAATFNTAITGGKIISSTVIHNLYYRLQLPSELTISAAVENIADRDPSFARLDYSYDPFTGNATGRTFKLGVNKKF